eukprot:scaffold1381_cov386-Prasinococcus_capsulatus_cf.AAC.11
MPGWQVNFTLLVAFGVTGTTAYFQRRCKKQAGGGPVTARVRRVHQPLERAGPLLVVSEAVSVATARSVDVGAK